MVMEQEDYTHFSEENPLGRLLNKIRRPRSAWYVWAMRMGRPLMLGGYDTEDEAYRDATMRLDCQFEVIELPTIDKREAWRILRKRMLDKGEQLDELLQRAKHKVNYKGDGQ